MRLYTTINYSDIYTGPKPDKEDLLKNIPSKLIILILCAINAELASVAEIYDVQLRMIQLVSQRFPPAEKIALMKCLQKLQQKTGSPPIVWARRYVLAFMKYIFLHYHDIPEIALNAQHEINIFKVYLLVAEELNEQDGKEFKRTTAFP